MYNIVGNNSSGGGKWCSDNKKLYVIKRDGRQERLQLDKITMKLQHLSFDLNKNYIDPAAVTLLVVKMIYPGVTTQELDMQAARETANMAFVHDDYALLAGRIMVNNLHKNVSADFKTVIENLFAHSLVSRELYEIVQDHHVVLNAHIDHKLDYNYKYFGYKTLENGYLKKINNDVSERIQHMLMRVALGIHGRDIDDALSTYTMMANRYFTHASPTLFAAGTDSPQLSSCFLLSVREDSVRGIYETLRDCALISKFGGGIGLNVHEVRAHGSYIKSTNGTASGLGPMLRVFNNAVRHVDQGGKRKGAMAIYVEPWHADIYDFLDLKRNMGSEDKKARDLLYALWVPDLFMKRVEQDGAWSLMCPSKCSDLHTVHGAQFEALYTRYENEKLYERQVRARDLIKLIIETQVETGTPYMLYKDACNAKSNQKNLGTLKGSNLCAEILQYTDADETAVCNLASVCVNRCIEYDDENNDDDDDANNDGGGDSGVGRYNFETLKEITKTVVRNLNKIIDRNMYPVNEARISNLKHRPVGVGIQGLADTFVSLRMPYESERAKTLNKQIAETIYYGALEASCELAAEQGAYETYAGSPASRGQLQYDMWNVRPTNLWNWQELKKKIAKNGLRNSLLVAYMPTATTAQIMGNNESFEPFTNNLYVRRVLAGEFQIINPYLIRDLIKLNLYNEDMRNRIIAANGSVQRIDSIPDDIKKLYKTVWEMKVKNLIEMAADRGAFIDQSQSFNHFVAKPSYSLMVTIHMHAWKSGLKTGMYYLRTKPAADAIKFTVDKLKLNSSSSSGNDINNCDKNELSCHNCSS
ncbi:Ribonucleotide reductase subunit 1 [Trabala vishnou gigantina nucleopolyhedrovirus]|uniref:Ribonucleotide reductase subunit 1 n=1 Tax=Trabala vishnou gigantina nucleopolyhedrovirus TaxID=2863583 RepID=UPI002481F847|nr:Ribonucleotide reductase subunit 1 [Trabala vishnou gigantina nucleopolyhedrovirus]QYC92657.1 Ribonucleotide reductase subunit 1 [Trabala vishnou gigantina nucleopolyhedrovirus]